MVRKSSGDKPASRFFCTTTPTSPFTRSLLTAEGHAEALAPEAASAALSADPDLDPASEALTADAPAEPAGFDPPEPLTSASEDELTLAKGKSKSKSKSKAKVKLVSSTRSFAKDVQGTVEGLEDPDGTSDKNERYALDPYGALENENQLSAEAKANPVRFQGFTYDSASDLYDMQARHYRPEVGRFLTRDRYESSALDVNLEQDPLTNNMYAFAGGNPVNGVEWDGHCSNNAQVQWGLTNGVVVKCLTDQPGTNGGTAHGPATAPPAGYSAPPGVTTPFSAPKPAPGAPADMSSYASMNVQFARPLPGPGLTDRAVSAGVWYFGSPAACARQFKGWTEEDSEPCGAAVLTVATLGSGAALRAMHDHSDDIWELRFTTAAHSSDSGFDSIHAAIADVVETVDAVQRVSTASSDGAAKFTVRLRTPDIASARERISAVVATETEHLVQFHSYRLVRLKPPPTNAGSARTGANQSERTGSLSDETVTRL